MGNWPIDEQSPDGPSAAVIKLSFFRSVRDIHPVRREMRWASFAAQIMTRTWSPASGWLPEVEVKKSLPTVSPAIYPMGATRGQAHLLGAQLVAIDIDNSMSRPTGGFHLDAEGRPTDRQITEKAPLPCPLSFAQVVAVLEGAGIDALVYTTSSHRPPDWPRIRIFIPLAEPVEPRRWASGIEWVLVRTGLAPYRNAFDMPVIRNPAALAILPASPHPETIERAWPRGEIIRVPIEDLVMPPTSSPITTEWQKRMKSLRLPGGFGLAWRDPIPLDPAQTLRALGCRVGGPRPWIHGVKHRSTCPWAQEHTAGLDDDGAVLYFPSSGRPFWRCAHSGHAHLGLRDVFQIYRSMR